MDDLLGERPVHAISRCFMRSSTATSATARGTMASRSVSLLGETMLARADVAALVQREGGYCVRMWSALLLLRNSSRSIRPTEPRKARARGGGRGREGSEIAAYDDENLARSKGVVLSSLGADVLLALSTTVCQSLLSRSNAREHAGNNGAACAPKYHTASLSGSLVGGDNTDLRLSHIIVGHIHCELKNIS